MAAPARRPQDRPGRVLAWLVSLRNLAFVVAFSTLPGWVAWAGTAFPPVVTWPLAAATIGLILGGHLRLTVDEILPPTTKIRDSHLRAQMVRQGVLTDLDLTKRNPGLESLWALAPEVVRIDPEDARVLGPGFASRLEGRLPPQSLGVLSEVVRRDTRLQVGLQVGPGLVVEALDGRLLEGPHHPLGLAGEAVRILRNQARSSNPKFRWPATWGPNFDWLPDQNHGGNLMATAQLMLLQAEPLADGGAIRVLPAWPKAWDVDFLLLAPGDTTVRCVQKGGKIVTLEVRPAARRKDVVLPPQGGRPTKDPPAFVFACQVPKPEREALSPYPPWVRPHQGVSKFKQD